jgi:hypothetical protein
LALTTPFEPLTAPRLRALEVETAAQDDNRPLVAPREIRQL